jgi:putative intracellular protease/amidase
VLASTGKLAEVDAANFNAGFQPGGHGPLWDLAEDKASIAPSEPMAAGKPVVAVCRAPGVLRHVKAAGGTPLVKVKKVTGFTSTEEEAVSLTEVLPFLVEAMLKKNGRHDLNGAVWQSYVLTDGKLIAGQNPASTEESAKALVKLLA